MKDIDYSLYLVTDRRWKQNENKFLNMLEEALKGGVSILQLREKQISTKSFYDLAMKVKSLCDRYDVPLIINDRVDILLAVDASGIHIGKEDLPVDKVRKLIGLDKIIGISVSSENFNPDTFDYQNIDYISLSPIYYTSTKKNISTPWGKTLISEIKRKSPIPVLGIGGIHLDNVKELIQLGLDGVCMVSEICASLHPYESTKEIKKAILGAKNENL